MAKRLFLLDGMALVYRAHFAFIARPILTSKGVNSSALYGFTQTLLDILSRQQPTHLGVAFDTAAPTARHIAYPEYKATREEMPEDLSIALPHVRRMVEAFNIPLLIADGFEADDIIGTLARRAEKAGFETFMVTPDKDFGQLVDENTFLFKPGRSGDEVEILGVDQIKARWGIQKPEQVVDVLALMGDSSDNVPGVPGIGEKTAIKLIGEYGSVENLLARTADLKGRVKDSLEKNRDLALLSKHLVTILNDAPCPADLETLKIRPPDEEKVKALLVEFEFNSIGRRLFGEDFKAGRGFQQKPEGAPRTRTTDHASVDSTRVSPAADEDPGTIVTPEQAIILPPREPNSGAGILPAHFGQAGSRTHYQSGPGIQGANEPSENSLPKLDGESEGKGSSSRKTAPDLKRLDDTPHNYQMLSTPQAMMDLVKKLQTLKSFCFKIETAGEDPKQARVEGLAISFEPHAGFFVPLPNDFTRAAELLESFRPVLESESIEKVGHNLKFDLSVLRWLGLTVRGKLFDSMVAHSLIEPDARHSLDYLSEAFLGYALSKAGGEGRGEQLSLGEVVSERIAGRAIESADIALQVRAVIGPLLIQKGQERVFYEVEAPLIPVLVEMEHEGIKVDATALAEFASQLAGEMSRLEKTIWQKAGGEFNLNSPRQLGEVLFEKLKISGAPKKTRTGQYSTDEQTLLALAPENEIVQRLLDFRAATKLKSTYADALPVAIWPKSGRIHTTYNQVATSTGRLNSVNPNLQNIPIRTERGQEIRKAFVPRDEHHLLLSADYSQIELRIIAALSQEAGLLEAFRAGLDVHTATAAKVYNVALADVTPEMRRKAKMVNYGIAYGISAFGLSHRLGIPRKEGAEIIGQYFKQFPVIRSYMDDTIAFARKHGYVETVTGRRRYLRDINSANATVRGAAERNAINAPIQGTAADMIKLAMIQIQHELTRKKLRTRMLLQVHDELVFDLFKAEQEEVLPLVVEKMKSAISLDTPIEVEMGMGENWLAAH